MSNVTLTFAFATMAEAAAFLAGRGETAAAPAPAKESKSAKTESKKEASGPTRDQMQALLTKLKDEKGADKAKAIIKEAGFAKMAEITDDKIAEVAEAAKKALEASDDDM